MSLMYWLSRPRKIEEAKDVETFSAALQGRASEIFAKCLLPRCIASVDGRAVQETQKSMKPQKRKGDCSCETSPSGSPISRRSGSATRSRHRHPGILRDLRARAHFPVLSRYHIRRKSFPGSIPASGFPNALESRCRASRFSRFRFLRLEDFSSVGFDNSPEPCEYKALPNIFPCGNSSPIVKKMTSREYRLDAMPLDNPKYDVAISFLHQYLPLAQPLSIRKIAAAMKLANGTVAKLVKQAA
jgi:hypothetical protein